jgi:hypothetical protein
MSIIATSFSVVSQIPKFLFPTRLFPTLPLVVSLTRSWPVMIHSIVQVVPSFGKHTFPLTLHT